MLLLTGILSINGLATAAIDYPLHGSRGFDLTGDGNDEINASSSILHYVNLASLLTIRDNFRQSMSDVLGLRLGLNFMGAVDTEGNPTDLEVDASTVHSFGVSLGAIMGINNIALSNTPLDPAVDGFFNITSASLAAPGLMFANFGMESPTFSGLAKSNLTLAASPEFKGFVDATFPDGYSQEQLTAVYEMFYANLSPEQQAGLNDSFAQFTLIAQTVSEAGDPINYVNAMAATQTPTHLIEIVGNGMDNLPDQVVTNTAPFTPLGGTEPAIALLGLSSVSETSSGSGAVRFVNGHHSSVLNPLPNSASPDAALSARATQEMQTQVAGFFATMGQLIIVTDTDVVLQ
jgi:Pla-1/cef family extracellular lipase